MYTSKLSLPQDVRTDPLAEFLGQLQFDITAFGRWECQEGVREASFTIPDFEVAYLLKGSLTLKAEGKTWTCESGCAVLLEPFTGYHVTYTGEEKPECLCFHFDFSPNYRATELKGALLGVGGPVFQPQELPQLNVMFTLLEKDMQSQAIGCKAMLALSFQRVLIYMVRARHQDAALTEESTTRVLTPREVQIVNDSMMYIEENLSRPLKITDISGYLGISENYLYKSFMNVMKISPSRYLLQYKVKRAECLLRTGNYSVEQISRMLGFSSLFHFSKTFKDFFGASPKQYLKSISC